MNNRIYFDYIFAERKNVKKQQQNVHKGQVNGRDEISIQEKVGLDLVYFEQQSLLLDAKILAMTVFSVYGGDGVRQEAK